MQKKQLPVLPPSPLPPLYAAWIDQLLAGPIPPETDATCDDCAMLPEEGGEAANSSVFFNPQTKCCSYIPAIPNFLIGRILEDQDHHQALGRATVENRIDAGVGVTPLGLEQPQNFQVLYRLSGDTLFGQSRNLRCPHYLEEAGGRCGVWKHRASICATWHCKYVRGLVGNQFWTTLHQLLSRVERSLSHWCVLELEIGPESLSELFPARKTMKADGSISPRALDGLADPAASRLVWGKWVGREEEFYRECAHLVNPLDWQEVIDLNRGEIQLWSRLLREAYQNLNSEELPERLKVGALQVLGMDQDSCSVNTYSPYDPINVPRELIEVLGYFDGRPTVEALEAISEGANLRVDTSLVRKLTDFGLLIPVPVE